MSPFVLWLAAMGGAVFVIVLAEWAIKRVSAKSRDQRQADDQDKVQLEEAIEDYQRRLEDMAEQLKAKDQPTVDPVALYRAIEALPSKVLQTINGSINPQKGKVAELLALAELRADYDQIVPLGKPVDYICFKYSTDDSQARIDFVEVKSGASQLTPDEKFIKQIVDHKSVAFRLIRVADEVKLGAGLDG